MKLCTIPDCGYPADAARGWCRTHYNRWNETGDPQAHIPVRRTMPAADRIEDFEFMLDTGETVPNAVRRMRCSAKTIIRAYQRLGKPIPTALFAIDRQREDVA